MDSDVEAVARAIEAGNNHLLPYEYYLEDARAAIAALQSRGWRKVGPGKLVMPEPDDDNLEPAYYSGFEDGWAAYEKAMIEVATAPSPGP